MLLWRTQHDGRVDAAEAERVGNGGAGTDVAAIVGDVVEIAGVVAILLIQRRRNPAALEGETTEGGLDGAGRAQRMGVVGLAAGDGDLVSALAEDGLEGDGLGGVVQRRGGTVCADEVDVAGREAGLAER